MIALICTLAFAQDPLPTPAPPSPVEPAPAATAAAPEPPVAVPEALPAPVPAPPPVPEVSPPPVVAPTPAVPASPPELRAGFAFDPFHRGPRERPADVVEFSIEIGTLAAHDDQFEVFSYSPRISSWGFRAGFRPIERLVLFGEWQRDRTGLRVDAGEGTDAGSSLGTHQLAIGARADLPLMDGAVRPYVAVGVLGIFGTARFDDDTSDPESLGQVSWSAFAPGGLAVGGLELRVVPVDRLALSWHLELGYALVGDLDFEDYGVVDVGGMLMRTGFGIRL